MTLMVTDAETKAGESPKLLTLHFVQRQSNPQTSRAGGQNTGWVCVQILPHSRAAAERWCVRWRRVTRVIMRRPWQAS